MPWKDSSSVLLRRWGVLAGQVTPRALIIGLAVAIFGIAIFGSALDRYVASFFPSAERLAIIIALAVGTVIFVNAELSELFYATKRA